MSYKNLKHYRHTIHLYLDAIWRMSSNSKKARTSMYNWLSVQMNLPKEQTHASLFNRNQCRQAIKILRTKYIQLYGNDLPYKKKERIKDMKINTKLLQEMVAKAIKGASDNKMIPITSLIGIEVKEQMLTLMTTDGSNHLRITEKLELNPLEGPTNFYTVVNAETFSKLVSKTTTENMTLTVTDNYLEVKGNGTYKLEIPMDEDGNVIKFLNVQLTETTQSQKLSIQLLKTILSTAKVSVAKTMELPCLTGYYLGTKAVTTDRTMMCCVSENILENPILISTPMAELLQLLEGNDVNLIMQDNKLLFETDNVVVYGKQLEGLDIYPVQALENLMNLAYDNCVTVKKQDLLDVLDRTSIFVYDYDNNGIYLTFTENGLQLTSKKSNSTETIEMTRNEDKEFVPFRCLIDIEMLKSQVQTNSTDVVKICYGQEKSIKILDGNTTMVISLLDDEE